MYLFCTGIGGNLVAIQASRISTYLHLHSIPGELPEEAKGCCYPCRTYYGTGMYTITVCIHNNFIFILLIFTLCIHQLS